MPDEMNRNDPRGLWQQQEVERITLTIDQVRARATAFERRIRNRNIREYIAGVVVIAAFGLQLWRAQGWRVIPPALMLLATIYVLFQLHRRAGVRSVPADMGLRGSIEFHRMEMERQRDAVRGVWNWYLLPFVPGLIAALVVTAVDHGINGRVVGMGVFFILIFAGIWALNKRGAQKLDRKIQELKAMEKDNE